MRIPDLPRRALARFGLVAVRPVPLLLTLAVVELATVAWLAFDTPHNGWVWHSGGDATEYWTAQWAVAHGFIPQAVISYGLPVFYGWIPLVSGTTLLQGLPVIVGLQVLILVPLVLVLVWAVADQLYGRAYAAVAAAIWAFGPLLMMLAVADRYRPSFEQYFLAPHWAGLTNMADLPSVAAVLATMWAALRAVDSGRVDRALLAGAFAGVAIGLKPANSFFIPALVVLFAAVWRPRLALACAAGLAPALLTLIVWKSKGLGHLPITSTYAATREAAAGPLASSTSHYVPLDFHHLKQEFRDFQEVFWSIRLLEFLAVAGIAGAIRRVPAKGLFLATWFAAFLLVKGSTSLSELANASYFRFVAPGLPAFVLLIPAIGFLWPVRGRRISWRPEEESFQLRRWPALATTAAVGLVPLLIVAVLPPSRTIRVVRAPNATEAPISSTLTPAHKPVVGGVELDWRPPSVPGSTRIRYAVFRTAFGDGCERPAEGAVECFLNMDRIASTGEPGYIDRPPAGRYVYRIGVVADWRKANDALDLMLISEPVSVRVR